jgi:hypothetical protein
VTARTSRRTVDVTGCHRAQDPHARRGDGRTAISDPRSRCAPSTARNQDAPRQSGGGLTIDATERRRCASSVAGPGDGGRSPPKEVPPLVRRPLRAGCLPSSGARCAGGGRSPPSPCSRGAPLVIYCTGSRTGRHAALRAGGGDEVVAKGWCCRHRPVDDDAGGRDRGSRVRRGRVQRRRDRVKNRAARDNRICRLSIYRSGCEICVAQSRRRTSPRVGRDPPWVALSPPPSDAASHRVRRCLDRDA